MKKFALVGALAALTIATAACGGGSDTLSEDDYIDQLDDICSRADRDLEDIEDPQDYRDIVDASEEAISITGDAIDDIRELEPPEDLERDHEDYIGALEDVVGGFEELRDAGEDEDDDAISEAGETITDATDEADSIAESIGADDCVAVGGESDDPDEPTDTTEVDEPADTTEPDEPADTTEPDEPADTTEPDEPTDTTVEDGTIPRITVPPVDMTMPADTEPPVVTGSEIGTIDFNELTLPVGYTFENADAETLTNIQNLYAEAFAGQIEAIGGAGVVDDVTGEVFSVFVFFWYQDLDDVTGPAFVADLASADDVASTEQIVTPNGLFGDRIVYTDQTEALVVWGGAVSIVTFGDPGSAASLATLMDALGSA